MKKLCMEALLLWLPLCALAQDLLPEQHERLDSVVVSATRAGTNTPMTFSTADKAFLRAADPSASLPMALQLMPSVVTYNEGGTGLGNSAMTIRGAKGSQINVTLNGITLNDAESQEVFWVNIPALTRLLSSVQVQRGLGTSASGAGAFGASINMSTAFVEAAPSLGVDVSGGSYGTALATVQGATGLMRGGFYASGALSFGRTDGYIDGAWVRSSSAFVVAGLLREHYSLRFTYLNGVQRSGITWDGISLEQMAENRRYNGAGLYTDLAGMERRYPNHSDNYAQHHFQLNYTRQFSSSLAWSNTLNYTRGDGYDEYLKPRKSPEDYGIEPVGFDPLTSTHPFAPGKASIIYQKRMANDHYVLQSDLRYRTERLEWTSGVHLSHYRGLHWGEVLWVGPVGGDYNVSYAGTYYKEHPWYENTGEKSEISAFSRGQWQLSKVWTAYADAQFRLLRYQLSGVDDDWLSYGAVAADRLNYQAVWPFFNPRAGLTGTWGAHKGYASVALGHREPGRGDIKENVKGTESPLRPERMCDVEVGYTFTGAHLRASACLYLMEYWDMLIETGRLSSSGYAIKENIDRGYRRGLELVAAYQPLPWLTVDANTTLSRNRIADYTAYIPYTDYTGVHALACGETDMLLSPSVTGMGRLTLEPWSEPRSGRSVRLSVSGRYVGRQYLDNTSRALMEVPAYYVVDAMATYTRPLRTGTISVSLYGNNVLNRLYYASGWRYEEYDVTLGEIMTELGVYPQAPANGMLRLTYSF